MKNVRRLVTLGCVLGLAGLPTEPAARPRLGAKLATSSACTPAPRFVFDPPGTRHSLPQLTWDAKGYSLVGYDGPPLQLHLTTIGLARGRTNATKSTPIGPGGVAATASNGHQIGIVLVDTGANVPRPPASGGDQFIEIDGRRVHAPRSKRQQSFFTVVNRDGTTAVKRIALGDQRVMHTSPGVAIAWNSKAREWGVVWNELNLLKFARIDARGRIRDERSVVLGGQVNPFSKLAWTGTHYAFLSQTTSGLFVFEIDRTAIRKLEIPITGSTLEPVIAARASGGYGVAYRTTRTVVKPAPPQPVSKHRPPRVTQPPPEIHELWFVAVEGGKVGARQPIAQPAAGTIINSPVLAADGDQFVVTWGERRSAQGFDDRLKVARLDPGGRIATGYPIRLDPEEVHQGYASIAGTGCDLAISYVLGDPNQEVRVAVIRAP